MEKVYALENFLHMAHGGDYNPDQWKEYEGIVDEDILLMDKAGCNVFSVGIFAWTLYEPEEGKFDFSYMDMVLDKLNAAGKKVIMATPSGARPAWLVKKYPSVMQTEENGQRMMYSHRHNHCYCSEIYRQKVKIIDEKLAQRYGKHPAVIGWHLSNEYGSKCYCEDCVKGFREYLKKKFNSDIKKLNAAYWTYFWSHEFTDWDEIEAPGYCAGRENSFMGLNIDWDRYCSDMQLDFMKMERDAVKKYASQPITTNFMESDFDKYNYAKWAKELDFVSWDSYPAWHSGDEKYTAARAAFNHDYMRSMLKKPFYLMESTPSLVNWKEINRLKKPGMHMLSSMQAIAHGADSVLYFQWRKGRGGSEKFHGAVVDHYATDKTRVFKDVAEVGSALKKLDGLVGSRVKSKVAIVFDWENRMALKTFVGFNNIQRNYVNTCIEHYTPFWKNGVNVDIISADDDFKNYDLVIMPMLYMIKSGIEEKIESYVKNGGNAVMTYLSGMVDENDLCYTGGFPAGKLKDVFGIWDEETESFWPGQKVTNSIGYKGNFYRAKDMLDIIHLTSAKAICSYNKDFYAGEPAVTVNEYGKGKAYYIAMRDEGGAFLNVFYRELIDELALERALGDFEPYEYLSAHTREDDENKYLFIENYSPSECTIEHPHIKGTDILTGEEVGEYIEMGSYGVKIIKTKK